MAGLVLGAAAPAVGARARSTARGAAAPKAAYRMPTHSGLKANPLAMARAIRSQGAVESGLLLCGEEDMLSSTDEGAAQALADAAGWRYQPIARAAHAAPIEQPVAWRKAVLSFLDAP